LSSIPAGDEGRRGNASGAPLPDMKACSLDDHLMRSHE
jgi:hypothetical protein